MIEESRLVDGKMYIHYMTNSLWTPDMCIFPQILPQLWNTQLYGMPLVCCRNMHDKPELNEDMVCQECSGTTRVTCTEPRLLTQPQWTPYGMKYNAAYAPDLLHQYLSEYMSTPTSSGKSSQKRRLELIITERLWGAQTIVCIIWPFPLSGWLRISLSDVYTSFIFCLVLQLSIIRDFMIPVSLWKNSQSGSFSENYCQHCNDYFCSCNNDDD